VSSAVANTADARVMKIEDRIVKECIKLKLGRDYYNTRLECSEGEREGEAKIFQ
jgi:hypothetical protein